MGENRKLLVNEALFLAFACDGCEGPRRQGAQHIHNAEAVAVGAIAPEPRHATIFNRKIAPEDNGLGYPQHGERTAVSQICSDFYQRNLSIVSTRTHDTSSRSSSVPCAYYDNQVSYQQFCFAKKRQTGNPNVTRREPRQSNKSTQLHNRNRKVK